MFYLFVAQLGCERRDRPVARSDVEDSGTVGQVDEFFTPELPDNTVIVIGLAGAERRDETLAPEC